MIVIMKKFQKNIQRAVKSTEKVNLDSFKECLKFIKIFNISTKNNKVLKNLGIQTFLNPF